VLSLALAACGRGGDAAALTSPAAPADPRLERPSDPCAFLSPAVVRDQFHPPANAALTPKRAVGGRCAYAWPRPDAERIRRENEQRAAEAMQAMLARSTKTGAGPASGGAAPGPAPAALQREDVQVAVVLSAREPSGPEEATAVYVDGLHEMDESATAAGAPPPSSVDGVGDQAAWDTRTRRLLVRADRLVFHLEVDTGDGDDADREAAVRLARALLQGAARAAAREPTPPASGGASPAAADAPPR
jgi:hypothetical protein